MNHQIISLEAQTTIADFMETHHSSLELYIENGHVRARECIKMKYAEFFALYITTWFQKHGFTITEWNTIVNELLNLYNKEKACQNQQKHLAPSNKKNS